MEDGKCQPLTRQPAGTPANGPAPSRAGEASYAVSLVVVAATSETGERCVMKSVSAEFEELGLHSLMATSVAQAPQPSSALPSAAMPSSAMPSSANTNFTQLLTVLSRERDQFDLLLEVTNAVVTQLDTRELFRAVAPA